MTTSRFLEIFALGSLSGILDEVGATDVDALGLEEEEEVADFASSES